jgi:hypothetical protein
MGKGSENTSFQIVNSYVERCSTSQITRKTRVKVTIRYLSPHVKMAIIKRTKDRKYYPDGSEM